MGDEPAVIVTPTTATLAGPEEAVRLVGAALTVERPGAQHTYAYKAGRWDGTVKFLRRPGNRFPSGLLARVISILVGAGYHPTVDIRGHGTPRPPLAPPFSGLAWRDCQTRAVAHGVKARRAIIQLPTGAGKTEVGAELVRVLGGRALWLVPTKVLLGQTIERLHRLMPSVDLGVVGDGAFRLGTVTVGIVSALKNSAGAPCWREVETLIVDEAHHAGAETWIAVAGACTSAWDRFGLSGTATAIRDPERAMAMEGALGPTEVVTDTVTLAREGFLAEPVIRVLRPPATSFPAYEQVREAVLPDWRRDPRRLTRMGGRLYGLTYDLGIVRNAERERATLRAALGHVRRGERVLVLCRLVEHARRLRAAWGQGLPAWQLDGKSPDTAKVIAEFRRAQSGVLFATPFFREGVDVPEIDALVYAAAGKAEVELLQALGRVLRPRPGKTTVPVYDFLDGGAPTGRADKDYLGLQAEERLALWRAQGFVVETQ